jgi:ribose transport system permease protein
MGSADATSVEHRPQQAAARSRWAALRLQNMAIVYVFILLVIVLAVASPTFLSFQNIINVIRQASVVGVLAIGMTFLLSTGQFDLSVGAQAGFAGVVVLLAIPSVGLVPSLVIALLVAVVIGTAIGLVVTKVGVNSLVTTLGALSILSGLLLVLTDGRILRGSDPALRWFGSGEILAIPIPVVVFLGLGLLGEFVLNHTRYGRYLLAIGGNAEASRLAGLRVQPLIISAFVLSSVLATVGGILLLGRIYSASQIGGVGMEFVAITAAVLGGTSIFGGEGSVWKTVIAVLLLQVLSNGFNLLNVGANYQQLIQGLIMIAAVSLYSYQRRKR